jgi:hypothetical protein
MPRRISKVGELSGIFVVRDPAWRSKIFFGGLLLLFVLPFGWPVALGYRKELISRLFSGKDPLLPEWRNNLLRYFQEGLKAMGVIFGYLSPLYLLLLFLLWANGITPNLYWVYSTLFFLVFPIFSTLSLPLAVFYWTFFSGTYRLPLPIALTILVLFAAIIFFIPAGFMQVSKSGRYLSAFNLRKAFSTIQGDLRGYLRAWYHSGLMSMVGHFALPLAPWGVVWCYLGIIFEFNAVLAHSKEIDSEGSWFARLSGSDEIVVEQTNRSFVLTCTNTADSSEGPCFLMKLGPILVPLPRIISQLLKMEPQ